jgi:hypothetical protein
MLVSFIKWVLFEQVYSQPSSTADCMKETELL